MANALASARGAAILKIDIDIAFTPVRGNNPDHEKKPAGGLCVP
jgi:hypothetical protein